MRAGGSAAAAASAAAASTHHLIVEAHGVPLAGIPLAVMLTGGHRHDVTQPLPLLDAVPPIRGLRGRPRRKPRELFANRGYDIDKYGRLLRQRKIAVCRVQADVGGGADLAVDQGLADAAAPESVADIDRSLATPE